MTTPRTQAEQLGDQQARIAALELALAEVLDSLGALTSLHELCGWGFSEERAGQIRALLPANPFGEAT